MSILFPPDPTPEDLRDFMDEGERRFSNEAGTQGIFLQAELQEVWRSIPDPTEGELQQLMPDRDWQHCQRGENREGILTFYRRKWKKDRKAAALEAYWNQPKKDDTSTPVASGSTGTEKHQWPEPGSLYKTMGLVGEAAYRMSLAMSPPAQTENKKLDEERKAQESQAHLVEPSNKQKKQLKAAQKNAVVDQTQAINKRKLSNMAKQAEKHRGRSSSNAEPTNLQKLRRLVEGLFGVIAVIAGTQLPNPLWSLLLVIGGWLLLSILVWELGFFSDNRWVWLRKIGNYIGSAVLLVVLILVWWQTRPEPPTPQATPQEFIEEFAKRFPVPEPIPDLRITVLGPSLSQYNTRLNLTELLIPIEVTNLGGPSAVKGWFIHYTSAKLNIDLRPVRPAVDPMLFPGSKDSEVALEFSYSKDAINEKTSEPVMKEKPVRGRLLLNIPGDRGRDVAHISVTITDHRDRESTIGFTSAPLSSREKIRLLPSEKFKVLTEKDRKRFR